MPERMAPPQIEPKSVDDYLEVMTKSVFQARTSWRVVESKWAGIREALHEFNTKAVAGLGPEDIDALVQDTRVIRNRRKLEGIAGNACRLLELEAEHGWVRNCLRLHADFDAKVGVLRKEFKFLGDMGSYHFLYVVGEEVPSRDAWQASRK